MLLVAVPRGSCPPPPFGKLRISKAFTWLRAPGPAPGLCEIMSLAGYYTPRPRSYNNKQVGDCQFVWRSHVKSW